MSTESLEELVKRVFRHPAYLAHALDGQLVRVCPGDGDVYIGDVAEDHGVTVENGKVLMNPDRHSIDCLSPDTQPIEISTPEVKENTELLHKLLVTLDWAEAHPDMVLDKSTGAEAFEAWITHVEKRLGAAGDH